MKKALAIGVLLLLFSFFAYNTYTYHQLSSAEGAYKLAGIPGDEKLIAVYHDSHFWQFATYNEKTNTLKLYTISQSSPFWPKKRKVESAKALVNYSPLSLDLKVLKDYKPHEKALLFKTLGWKYDSQINGSYWANLSEVIQPGEEYYRIYGLGISNRIWIRSKIVFRKSSMFEEDRVGYGKVGINGILMLPGFRAQELLWVVEKNVDGKVLRIAYYPNVTIASTMPGAIEELFNYSPKHQEIITRLLNELEGENPWYVEVWFLPSLKAQCLGYGQILKGHSFCMMYACHKENSTEVSPGHLSCISNIKLETG